MRGEQRRLKIPSPGGLDGYNARHVRFSCRPRVGARRAIGPWGEGMDARGPRHHTPGTSITRGVERATPTTPRLSRCSKAATDSGRFCRVDAWEPAPGSIRLSISTSPRPRLLLAGAVPFRRDRPAALRSSVVCRVTCRVRDLRVLGGGVGYSRPRGAATPPRQSRGASIRVTTGPTDSFGSASLQRRDRSPVSARPAPRSESALRWTSSSTGVRREFAGGSTQ